MSLELRMPNITGASEREQLSQIRSYLYQFIPQLQWALNEIGATGGTTYVEQKTSTTVNNSSSSPSTSLNPTVMFNELKPLIIKSAEIVQSYYEEINSRLVSEYTALSDFGTYTEKTEKLVRETASLTEETYSKFAEIDASISGIFDETRETRGYINHGIIVDSLSEEEAKKYNKQEGDSLIGVEVGQTDDGVFTRYARFTANRLSFYDQNDQEVAYVSDYKLYIRNVEITSSYRIGGFVETVDQNGDVVTKWIGGEQ